MPALVSWAIQAILWDYVCKVELLSRHSILVVDRQSVNWTWTMLELVWLLCDVPDLLSYCLRGIFHLELFLVSIPHLRSFLLSLYPRKVSFVRVLVSVVSQELCILHLVCCVSFPLKRIHPLRCFVHGVQGFLKSGDLKVLWCHFLSRHLYLLSLQRHKTSHKQPHISGMFIACKCLLEGIQDVACMWYFRLRWFITLMILHL